MSKVRRIYVEKKEPFAVAARQLRDDIIGFLAVKGLTGVRKLIRYDVENVSDEVFETACPFPDNLTRERTARSSASSF